MSQEPHVHDPDCDHDHNHHYDHSHDYVRGPYCNHSHESVHDPFKAVGRNDPRPCGSERKFEKHRDA